RLAPQIKRLGVPVIYYISPQIWAWRARRLETIRTFADRVLVIFPFEEAIYREGGVPVEFVGHPLVDLSAPSASREDFLARHRLSPMTYLIGKRLITVTTDEMVNLIAGEMIVPELIQDAFTPEAVAREAVSMLTDRERSARIREGLSRVRARLGGPGASRRAAESVLAVVRAHHDARSSITGC